MKQTGKWMAGGSLVALVAAQSNGIAQSKASSRANAQVEALSRARLKALVDRDEQALTTYYAPDFSLTTEDGTRAGVAYLREFIKGYEGKFLFAPSNYTITLSPDGKMAATDFDLQETYISKDGSKRNELSAVFTEVYVQTGGKWKLRHEHFSYKPVPKSN